MSDFNPSPYRGDANIGHVSEELFKMYFVGSNVSSMSRMFSLSNHVRLIQVSVYMYSWLLHSRCFRGGS